MQGKTNAKTLYIRERYGIFTVGKKSHKYTLVFVVFITQPKIWHRRCLMEDRIVLSHRFKALSGRVPPPMEMRFMVMTAHRTRTR